MPPIAIGAAVAAGAAAAVAGASIAAAVAIASVAFSVMTALTMKAPSFDGYTSAQERKQVLRSPASPKVGVYGDVIGSGVLFFAEEQSGEQADGELLHMCIAIAGHKLAGIEDIYLNDEPIATYDQYARYTFHNDLSSANPDLVSNCGSWTSDMIGKGIAFVHFVFKFNAEKFPTSIPNIKLKKRGFLVYDPRDGKTKFSANSALVYLHYLRNFCDVKDEDILFEQFKTCANICDEIVQTAEGPTVRYTTNGEFDYSESRIKVIEAILESCAGARVYTGGKHGMMVGAYSGPATMEIHSRQVCGDIRITPETSDRDRFNTYKGTFVNAKQGFTQCDFPQVSVAEWVQEDGGVIPKDIDYRFITNEYQAQRVSNLKLNRARKGRILTIPMNYSGFSYRPGINVKVYLPEIGIDGVEFKIDSWGFSVANAVTVTMIQDNASMYGDIIGVPVGVPPLTMLPSSGPAAPESFQFISEPVGEVIQGKLVWVNKGAQIVDNVITVVRNGVVQLMANAPGQELPLNGLMSGQYEARIFSVAVNGSRSPVVSLAFTVQTPPVPNTIKIIPDNWSIQLIPEFSQLVSFGTICEFYTSTIELPIVEVLEKAFYLGMGSSLIHSGLKPDTLYYYWVRSVNAYGKSALLAVSAKTTYDISSILDSLDGQIGAEHLREDLREPIDKIPEIEAEQVALGASVEELTKIVSDIDMSIVDRVENLSASVELAGEGALGAAVAGAEESERQRRATGLIQKEQTIIVDQQKALASELTTVKTQFEGELATTNAAVQQGFKALSDVDKALAEKVDTVSASVTQQGEELTAAVQTVANAIASVEGDVEAGWYTKAQINGQGGGFGLSVVLNEDGSVMSSFIVDADVFAIMSRASGETSTRHPFIVKNGSVYMNHAMMDTAEIGEVIAQYINVQHLVGTLIEGSSFRGGDIWLGENPNGAFSAYGKRWNAGINSNGQFFGSNVYFESGTYKGNIQANSGTLNNVVIREDCQVLGTVFAERIVGDIYGARGYTSSATGKVGDDVRLLFITVNDTFGKARVIHIPDMCGYCEAFAGYNKPTTLRIRVYATLNGVLLYDVARSVYIPGSDIQNDTRAGRLDVGEFMFGLPANASGGIDVRLHLTDGLGGLIRPGGFGVVSIFKQSLSLG